jgi:hypothetical protein
MKRRVAKIVLIVESLRAPDVFREEFCRSLMQASLARED